MLFFCSFSLYFFYFYDIFFYYCYFTRIINPFIIKSTLHTFIRNRNSLEYRTFSNSREENIKYLESSFRKNSSNHIHSSYCFYRRKLSEFLCSESSRLYYCQKRKHMSGNISNCFRLFFTGEFGYSCYFLF